MTRPIRQTLSRRPLGAATEDEIMARAHVTRMQVRRFRNRSPMHPAVTNAIERAIAEATREVVEREQGEGPSGIAGEWRDEGMSEALANEDERSEGA